MTHPASAKSEDTSRPMKLMEVARHLGVHPTTVRRMFRRGVGRKIGGRIYFDLSELDPSRLKEGGQ